MSLTNSEIAELRRAIASLRRHASENVDNLHGQLKVDFYTVSRYATLLNGTPAYETFHKLVREQFNTVESTTDSTIGVHLTGCMTSEKYGNSACAPSCLGNLPTSNTIPCDETVIVAIPENGGYFFITKNVGRKEYARLYLSEFKGFSGKEKTYLQSQGISAVILVDFQERPIYVNGSNISYVSDLPERHEHIPLENKVQTNDSAMLIIIFIVIFGLFIVIALLLYNRNNMSSL